MFSADCCFFPGAAISLERVSSYVFICDISLCRPAVVPRPQTLLYCTVVTTVHTSAVGKTN
jgi:hypothetical protein